MAAFCSQLLFCFLFIGRTRRAHSRRSPQETFQACHLEDASGEEAVLRWTDHINRWYVLCIRPIITPHQSLRSLSHSFTHVHNCYSVIRLPLSISVIHVFYHTTKWHFLDIFMHPTWRKLCIDQPENWCLMCWMRSICCIHHKIYSYCFIFYHDICSARRTTIWQ